MNHQEEPETYIIPPNFIDTGTVFGGTLRLRNAIEALCIALLLGIPILSLNLSLTTKIIIACLTVLPLVLLAIIGINGDSISIFLLHYAIYLKNRRIVGTIEEINPLPTSSTSIPTKSKRTKERKKLRGKCKEEDFPEEFGPIHKQKLLNKKQSNISSRCKADSNLKNVHLLNPVAEYLPISNIKNGIIQTKEHHYVKIIEIIPINFLLRSTREQKNIIYSFISYLKISPVKLQIKILTKQADINRHLQTIEEERKRETDERCIALQEDYEALIRQIGSKEAITRRFFIIFEYEPFTGSRNNDEVSAQSALQTAVQTARTYLQQCGNEVIIPESEDEFITDILYNLLNRRTSAIKPLSTKINEVIGQYINAGKKKDLDFIPATEFFAPEHIDFSHGNYCILDGVYHTYLLIPSNGYRTQVGYLYS